MAPNAQQRTRPNELFFPPVCLSRGVTKAKKALYSANVSKMAGPGAQLAVYIRSSALPSPEPSEVKVMAYRTHQGRKDGTGVYCLVKTGEFPGNAIRYDRPQHSRSAIHTVCFPWRMVNPNAPEELFLELTFPGSADGTIDPNTADVEDLVKVMFSKGAEYWLAISHWARVEQKFKGWERGLLYSVGKRIEQGQEPTEKQARHAVRLMQLAEEN